MHHICIESVVQESGSQRTRRWAMFVRKVAVRLKPNSLTEFTNLIEYEILPWLRTQEGFRGLITLAVPDGREVATISFWEHQRDAQAYDSSGYPESLRILANLLDGVPYLKTFNVVTSTFQTTGPLRQSGGEHLHEGRCDASATFNMPTIVRNGGREQFRHPVSGNQTNPSDTESSG